MPLTNATSIQYHYTRLFLSKMPSPSTYRRCTPFIIVRMTELPSVHNISSQFTHSKKNNMQKKNTTAAPNPKIQPARPGSGAALPVGGGDAALQIGDGGEAESTATAPQCPTRWSQVAAVHCGVTALVRDRVQRAGGQEGTVGPA